VLAQPLAVVREDRVVEDVVAGLEIEEPAEQEVGLQPSAEFTLGADRVQAPQQERLEQRLGRDPGRPTSLNAARNVRDMSASARSTILLIGRSG
jgi:hypothetical protein